MWRGLTVDEESTTLDPTRAPGGNYLAQQHIVRHSRCFGANLPLNTDSLTDHDRLNRRTCSTWCGSIDRRSSTQVCGPI